MKWILRLGKISLLVASPFVLLIFLSPARVTLVTPLVLGWTEFLQRTLPRITWNWDLIGMAALSFVIILLLGHWFLSRFIKSIAAKRGVDWPWPWKWTWSSLVALLLLFVVGMVVGGTAHQIGWLASSSEPLFERQLWIYDYTVPMQNLEVAIEIAAEDDNHVDQLRQRFWKDKDDLFSPKENVAAMLQKNHVLLVVDDKGGVIGTIIFPRDNKIREMVGGRCSLEEEDRFNGDWKHISALLKKYQGRLVSF